MVIFVFVASSLSLASQRNAATRGIDAKMDVYQSSPFLASSQIMPYVLIVLSKDIKMFQHGYPGLTDMDGDGRMDTGFNPGVLYVGYFDSYSCYKYSGSEFLGLSNAYYAYGDAKGYFYRVGPTREDETAAEIKNSRPPNLKSYVPSPRSVSGICNKPNSSPGERSFSGNWLNYIATSRMDAIRRVLYGGTRETDDPDKTTLVGSFVPPDAVAWGAEVRSDDTWQSVTPLSAYFDVRKYTVYDKPQSRTAHFFARGSDLGRSNGFFPALRVLLNADASSFNLQGTDNTGQNVTVTPPYGRYWDWVLVNRPLPDDKVLLNDDVRSRIKVYHIRVAACQKGNLGAGENCLWYPGASDSPDDDVHKPVGLLQNYGSGRGGMYFGLLTGSYNNRVRRSGGKLRNHVGPVLGVPPFPPEAFVPPVNALTGQVNHGGLIRNIDYLRIAGRDLAKDPVLGEGAVYANSYSWGNPLGEMVYEGVRYLAGFDSPTQSFASESDQDNQGSSVNLLSQFNSWPSRSWTRAKPAIPGHICFKPIMLIISDTSADYDGNEIGGELNKPFLENITFPAGMSLKPDAGFDNKRYLDFITRLEGLDTTGKHAHYFFSNNRIDTCSPKTLARGLFQVLGLCPTGPSTEGTYSTAAVAYYAHIHDLAKSSGAFSTSMGADVYAVTMSAAYPELVFPVKNMHGKVVKSVSVLPVNISSKVLVGSKILGFLNYFILEWDVDRNGLTYHAKIKVNFSDTDEGGDWDGDAQVTYTVDLLTDNRTPREMRETTSVRADSGADEAVRYFFYRFKNNPKADSMKDFISIQDSQVRAVLISTQWETVGTTEGMAMGYSVTGTTRDGTYLDTTMNRPPASDNLTPPGCHYLGHAPWGKYGCKERIRNLKSQSRAFLLLKGSVDKQSLPNPLYLAAKYGGFKDMNNNGIPDAGEWENDDGEPFTYFQATNIAELPLKLEAAFKTMLKTVAIGTSTSSALEAVTDGGVSVSTYFYHEYVNANDATQTVRWPGSVYGLFIDPYGNLREDTDGDGVLTLANGEDGGKGDLVVSFSDPKVKAADGAPCRRPGGIITLCYDPLGTNNLKPLAGSLGKPKNQLKLKSLFDAGRWLSRLDSGQLLSGPREYAKAATVRAGKRRIYYGRPKIGGRPGEAELALFTAQPEELRVLERLILHDNFTKIIPGAKDRRGAAEQLAGWVIGRDAPGLRSRAAGDPWGDGLKNATWRLGDVLNSKPVIVSDPMAAYDLLYRDASYLEFRKEQAGRRSVVYFGANDGMLHAVNLGFRRGFEERKVVYSLSGTKGKQKLPEHELGAEIWAYIPTSLLPHLQWLASPGYVHSYYVDLKPLVTDVKIKGRWRTVLIGGLRLGGRTVEAPDPALNNGGSHFFSEVFCLDVTDPEEEPKLLWRFSREEMGLTVGMPMALSSAGRFYAVIPSGPRTDKVVAKVTGRQGTLVYGQESPYDGHSSQKARLFVVDMETGLEVEGGGDAEPYLTAEEENSFFNHPFLPVARKRETPWNNQSLYFGLTVSRDPLNCEDKGAVYRLQTVDEDGKALPVGQWRLRRLFSAERPVTGAVNASLDPMGNLWVFFGTGRLWGWDDVSPCLQMPNNVVCQKNHEQYIFGLKEPLNDKGFPTYEDLSPQAGRILDVSGAKVYQNGMVTDLAKNPFVPVSSGNTATYTQILDATRGDGTIGYKRRLDVGRDFMPGEKYIHEMVVTQPKIVPTGNGKSLLAFTSYLPGGPGFGGCGSKGNGFLYLVNSFTGLPDPSSAVYLQTAGAKPGADPSKVLVTGAVSVGEGNPSEPYVNYTARGTTISATATNTGVQTVFIPTDSSQRSALIGWREVLNTGVELTGEAMVRGLD
ncbi:MAG: hypothetical protein LBR53_07680 [Deltaproteobacteria bacterium]|nr:hypothetical protein [Deltaproteobacteria bacterium]